MARVTIFISAIICFLAVLVFLRPDAKMTASVDSMDFVVPYSSGSNVKNLAAKGPGGTSTFVPSESEIEPEAVSRTVVNERQKNEQINQKFGIF